MDGRAADRQLQGTVGQARHQAKAQRLPACSDGIIQTAHRRRRSARKHHTELEFLERSSADVAEHVSIATGESDAVAGRIRFVPFELVVRNLYFRSDFDMRTVSRAVGPIGIKLCRSMMHWGHPAAPVLPAGRSKQASCRGAPSGADHASAGALSRRGTYENGASAVPVRGVVRCSVYVLTLFRFRQSVAVAASG